VAPVASQFYSKSSELVGILAIKVTGLRRIRLPMAVVTAVEVQGGVLFIVFTFRGKGCAECVEFKSPIGSQVPCVLTLQISSASDRIASVDFRLLDSGPRVSSCCLLSVDTSAVRSNL